MPWTVASSVPTLWHHPAAAQPIENIAPVLRQARLDATNNNIRYIEPELRPHQFFGLFEGWPAVGL